MEAKKLNNKYEIIDTVTVEIDPNDPELELLGIGDNDGCVRVDGVLYRISTDAYLVIEQEYINTI